VEATGFMGVPSDSKTDDPPGRWVLRGMLSVFSLPAAILVAAFIGFAGLARESGLTLAESVFMAATVWALPSQVILVGAITAGASVFAAALAVGLSAVRLMPMVVVWTPVIRDRDTPAWQLFVLSHFVAVTSWVFAMGRLPQLPRAARVPFFTGFATALATINISVVAVAYEMVGRLPEMIAGALFFLTPIYFLLSLWAASRQRADRVAMVFGLALGPVFYVLSPGFDLLWSGLIGGTAAYVIGRFGPWRA